MWSLLLTGDVCTYRTETQKLVQDGSLSRLILSDTPFGIDTPVMIEREPCEGFVSRAFGDNVVNQPAAWWVHYRMANFIAAISRDRV